MEMALVKCLLNAVMLNVITSVRSISSALSAQSTPSVLYIWSWLTLIVDGRYIAYPSLGILYLYTHLSFHRATNRYYTLRRIGALHSHIGALTLLTKSVYLDTAL